jgi:hypothetical protein
MQVRVRVKMQAQAQVQIPHQARRRSLHASLAAAVASL